MSPKQNRKHVAHHEAGHFVAAYFLGMHSSTFKVTIKPDGDAAGSNEGEYPIDDDPSLREIGHVCVKLFAGYEAEVRFDPKRAKGARLAASHDDAQAARWLRLFGKKSEQTEKRLRREARSLVEEHWPAIEALAAELLKHETLDNYEAEWVVAIAEGEAAKRSLAEYRENRNAVMKA